jgi:hypothetical protein
MSSERRNGFAWACAVFAAWALVALNGCGPKRLPTPVDLPMGADTGCLAKSGPVLARFADGAAGEGEVSATWNCAIRALKLFGDREHGEREGVYSPEELAAFLEKYFLAPGTRIPEGLLGEAMELKRVLLGGSAARLTRAELARAGEWLAFLRDRSLALRPYMPLTPAKLSALDDAGLAAALQALRGTAQALGTRLDASGQGYAFARLGALLDAIQGFRGATPWIARVRERLGLAALAKSAFVAPGKDGVATGEWRTLLTTAADAYGLWLKYARIESISIEGDARERLYAVVSGAFDLLDQALARRPGRILGFDELDELLQEALPGGVAVTPTRIVPYAHVRDFAHMFVQRMMGGADAGATGRAAEGLTRAALGRLRARIDGWNQAQRFIEGAYAAAAMGSRKADGAQVLLTPLELVGYGKLAWSKRAPSEALGDAPARLVRRAMRDRALFRPVYGTRPGEIYLDGHDAPAARSLYDLTQLNWTYALASMMIEGYADDPARAARASADGDDLDELVSRVAFSAFVDAVTPVGVDIKVVDPADPLLAAKRFREAELFTFAGTGSQSMSVRQAAQLVSLMVSAKRLALEIHQGAIDAGCRTYGVDPFEFDYVDADCYRRHFFAHVREYWANLPRLANYYLSLGKSARQAFERDLENGARKLGYSSAPINSSDSEGYGAIGQYIEVLFSRFDADDSGGIDNDEAEQALSVFKGSLHEMSCLQGNCLDSDAGLKTAFLYLLDHGAAPGTAGYVFWRLVPIDERIDARRGTLMSIFGALSTSAQ